MNISLSNFNVNNIGKNQLNTNYAYSYSPLKPLTQDRVSFSGRKTLIASDMSVAPSISNCAKVSKYAEPAKYYLERILSEYVGPYVDTTDNMSLEKYPVLECKVRVKKPLSIREKVVSKYSAMYSDMAEDFKNKVYAELLKYYEPNPNCDIEDILTWVKTCIDGHDDKGFFLAHLNPAFNYHIALQILQENNAFKFDAVDEQTQAEIDTKIINEIAKYISRQEKPVSTETQEGIKYYANDIIGARIVLREADPKCTQKVFNALKTAVKHGKLKITSIENNIPDPNKLPEGDDVSNYKYAYDSTLLGLQRESGAQLITRKSKSGYMAVHINVDFSDCDFAKQDPRYAGFKGEIQIIGREVEILKEIEDLCYKLKDNKNAIKSEYAPFKHHFQKYYVGDTKAAFDDYTYKLYLEQRRLKKTPKKNGFLTAKQLGFGDTVPKELDFNTLAKIKKECDRVIERNELLEKLKATCASDSLA